MIVDRHPSCVSTKIIRFAQEHKIMCLSLPAHSTQLLQPLDLWIFSPLKKKYNMLLVDKIQFTMYNIDKADFISLIPLQATRLIPYNLSTLLNKIWDSHTDSDTLPSASIPI